jgi:DNA invertase Pin-like site-specific DNA recombinase
MNFDTASPTGKMMLTILGSIAEFEREIMLERQKEGIAKAHSEGKYRGKGGSSLCTRQRWQDPRSDCKRSGDQPR